MSDPRVPLSYAAKMTQHNIYARESRARDAALLQAEKLGLIAESAEQEPRFKIGKKGLAILAEKFGRELTPEEIDGLERGMEADAVDS